MARRNPANHHQGPAPDPWLPQPKEEAPAPAAEPWYPGPETSQYISLPKGSADAHQKIVDTHWRQTAADHAPRRSSAPSDPMSKWTNEELATGMGRQGRIKDNSAQARLGSPLSGERDAAAAREQVAQDSTYVIQNELNKRTRRMRNQ